MSPGSYFSPPVLGVKIPKSDGGVTVLGIPMCQIELHKILYSWSLNLWWNPFSFKTLMAIDRGHCGWRQWVSQKNVVLNLIGFLIEILNG